jgi:uncharacterized protein (UPF0261 family)
MELLCIGTADTKLDELLFLAARLRSTLAATSSAQVGWRCSLALLLCYSIWFPREM